MVSAIKKRSAQSRGDQHDSRCTNIASIWLTKINGEPTHTAVKQMEREIAANLMAVESQWGLNKGHLGKLLSDAIVIAR